MDAASFVASVRARGVTLLIRNGRLWLLPPASYKELSDDEHLAIRHHRAEIKAIVASFGGLPPPPAAPREQLQPAPPAEPEPVVLVQGRRITDAQVREVLKGDGDEALAEYESGAMSKATAYERARVALRQSAQFGQIGRRR